MDTGARDDGQPDGHEGDGPEGDRDDGHGRGFLDLTDGAALLDLGPGSPEAREVVHASGADRVRFLNGIVTGSVATTPVGGGCHATLLTLKAHVVAELRIFVRPEDVRLVVAGGQGVSVAAALARYAITDDFDATPMTNFALLGLLGPAADRHLLELGYPVGALAEGATWSHAESVGPFGALWLVRVHQLGADGYWIGAPGATLARVREALGARGLATLTPGAATAARVVAFEPAWGREITDGHFPMEVGLADTIDYKKGCFLGQEPIVRIRDRGHLNWRLAQLQVVGEGALPDPATWQIEASSKARAGTLTTVARVPGEGVLALALLHASVQVGATVALVGPEGARLEATVVRD